MLRFSMSIAPKAVVKHLFDDRRCSDGKVTRSARLEISGKPCRYLIPYENHKLWVFRTCLSVTCACLPTPIVRPPTCSATRCCRPDRHRNRDQQSVCAADRERHHLLQLRHPLAPARQARGEWERESPDHDQEDLTGGVAPRPSERALHVPQRRADHRPGCDRGRARFGLTEFSGVWAYTPVVDR